MSFDGVLFRTTDGTRWGSGKGSPLTSVEVDLNFWEVINRVKNIEDHPPSAVSISNISVLGSQMLITMSDASTFGPFTLPIARFNFRGEYTPTTPYFELDLITVTGSGLYMLTQDYTPPAMHPFNPNEIDGSGNNIYVQVFGSPEAIYDFGFYWPGLVGQGLTPTTDVMFSHILGHDVTVLTGLGDSKLSLVNAPADADMVLTIKKNRAGSALGTITFATGDNTATVSFATDVDFAAGDSFDIYAPAAVDSAAKGLAITIVAERILT